MKNVSALFGVGVHVILGRDADGTGDLIELCAGLRLPRRGRLLLDREAPSSSPGSRQRIASLLPVESLPSQGSLESYVAELARLQGVGTAASLQRFAPHLEPSRPVASLSSTERRQLALAVALGHPGPKLVALHDPLAAVPPDAIEAALARIRELGTTAVVAITTASVGDARRIGGALYVLERGVLVRRVAHAWPGAITPGLEVCLVVDCDSPRELLAALAQLPGVEQARYDTRRGGRLELRGPDLEALALGVTRAAVAAAVRIRMLRVAAPDLDVVHGASAGLAHAAYRAAQEKRR
jgi:energy-coupling factor transporter ATP-binding protein EcfA2